MRQRTTHYSHVSIRTMHHPNYLSRWYYVETTPPRSDTQIHATLGQAFKEVQSIHTYNRVVPKR